MDKSFDTTTASTTNLQRGIPLIDAQDEVKTVISNKNLLLIGTWACAVLLSQSVPTDASYQVTTSISYANKTTQSTLSLVPELMSIDAFEDDEVNSELFVATQPKRSYAVKLKIKEVKSGEPVIDTDNNA